MGVLNMTPDSFSADTRHGATEAALAAALGQLADGAESLDIGGESTRPGAAPVEAAIELARVLPLLQALRSLTTAQMSIDTMKPQVARAAVAAGADIWNDVTGLTFDPSSADTAAELGCHVILTHIQGAPATMQHAPHYDDVVSEVLAWLTKRAGEAITAGVDRSRIWLDPGIGFGKTTAHNLALLGALQHFVATGFPILLGVSRKGFLKVLDPAAVEPGDRLGGSLACALAGAAAGVTAVRVHDVRQTVQALTVDAAIRAARANG